MGEASTTPVRNLLSHGEVMELIHSEVLFIKGMPVTSIFWSQKVRCLCFQMTAQS